jgi:hypothetical protein
MDFLVKWQSPAPVLGASEQPGFMSNESTANRQLHNRPENCFVCLMFPATNQQPLSVFSRAFREMHDMRVRLVKHYSVSKNADGSGLSMQLGWWLKKDSGLMSLLLAIYS